MQRQQLTVVPASQTVTLDSVDVDFVYAGEDATGTVTLSGAAPVGGAEILLSGTRQNGIATAPASVTIAEQCGGSRSTPPGAAGGEKR
ncbi:MAG TPA: hypothetical protein VF618_15755 [Thermoanaerobaculia bacterium]